MNDVRRRHGLCALQLMPSGNDGIEKRTIQAGARQRTTFARRSARCAGQFAQRGSPRAANEISPKTRQLQGCICRDGEPVTECIKRKGSWGHGVDPG